MTTPLIALIGRPNVGKSSLFNALLGYRRAIVLNKPGTTLDRLIETPKWADVRLLDFQGIWDEKDSAQLQQTLKEADRVIFVVDAGSGPTPFDKWIAKEILQTKKKYLLVINKIDTKNSSGSNEFAELGMDEGIEVSVSHRQNLEVIKEWISEGKAPAPVEPPTISIAILGRPNTGKSTLMNRLCGEQVSRVSPQPLTTRDFVTYAFETPQGRLRLFDTAGMRRPRSKKETIEDLSITAVTAVIEKVDVILLCLNSFEGISDQDTRLLNLCIRYGKPVLLLFNFWDMMRREDQKRFWDDLQYMGYLKVFESLTISSREGTGLKEIFPKVFKVYKQSQRRLSTSRLNDIVRKLVELNPPPTIGRANFNILYASQVKAQPPTFVFFMNRKEAFPPSYQRYLENGLRNRLRLKSQAMRLFFRAH